MECPSFPLPPAADQRKDLPGAMPMVGATPPTAKKSRPGFPGRPWMVRSEVSVAAYFFFAAFLAAFLAGAFLAGAALPSSIAAWAAARRATGTR